MPLALSAVAPETLQRLKINDVSALGSTVPGVTTVYQGLDQAAVVIRGITSNSIGIGGESSAGFFIDDVYVGRLQALSAPFLDVERVEVLRGPQGSLYGRNSTAGAISVVTNKPRIGQTSAELAASYGTFDSYDGTAVVNLPLGENVATRIAVLARGDSGFELNVANGERVQKVRIYSGRASFIYEPTDMFTANLGLTYSNERVGPLPTKTTDPVQAALSGVDTDPFSRRFAQNSGGFTNRDAYGATLSLSSEITDSVSFKSTTSFNRAVINALFDVDGTTLPLQEFRVTDQTFESLSQELRFNFERGALRVLVGGNAFFEWVNDQRSLTYDENVLLPILTSIVFGTPDGTVPAEVLGAGSPAFIPCDATSVAVLGVACATRQVETNFQRGRYLSLAGFVDAELKLSDTLTLIAGGRYSTDMKRFAFSTPLIASQGSILAGTNPLFAGSTNDPIVLSETWSDFQPRAVLRWQPSPLLNIYGSVTRGFKSGGFDPAAVGGVYSRDLTQFEPESVWSYEVGLKAALLDRLAEINLAGYRYTYKGFQAQIIRSGVTSTLNIPSYNAWGLEGDLTIRPNKMLNIVFGGAYNGAQFGNFIVDDRFNPGQQQNLRGNRGIVSPEFTAFSRADATIPINDRFDLTLAADVAWQSRQFFTIFGDLRESQAAYAVAGARVGIQSADEKWSAAVNVRNLFDQKFLTFAANQGFSIGTFRGRPRNISLDLRAKF
ncbi:MAG: TonB-dependent receptor [Sphingomonadaceae bacterium]